MKKIMNRYPFLYITLFFTFFLNSCAKGDPCRKIEKQYRQYRQSFAETPDISCENLTEKKADTYVLVDVREKKEREVSVIQGSISQHEFEKNSEQYKNKLIVPYCTIGYRSGFYTKNLIKKGLNAKNLKGGILAWICKKNTVTKNGLAIKKVHVYGPKWNLVPKDYEGVW